MASLPELEAEIEGLYRLPLAAFTPARDALVARCRSAGDREGAARVKKLAKPSASAWAVNQLHWSEREALERFLEVSREARDAQRTGQPAAAVREAMQRRREALDALVRRAEGRLEDAGHGTAPVVLRRITATLEAVAHRAATGDAVAMGRLAEDLESPGLDALLGLTQAAVLAFPAAESRRDVALTRLEADAARAARRAAEADADAAVARERLTAARAELQEAQRRLARAEERVGDAEAALGEAGARADAAARESEDAERALAAAREGS